jgi:phospholipase C
MFARYAGDNTNIVPLGEHASRLREDVAGRPEAFPSVVFIDPAFHHHPQNDDHAEDATERPAVDMWRGQQFLKDIYRALVSNRELWSKTLLIITYDEHGGFYDHVIPPLAEGLFAWRRRAPLDAGRGGMSSMTIPYGVRVPTFVVSPWVPAGKGPDLVLDFCSILKTIIARFLGTQRRRMSGVGPSHRGTTDTDRGRWVTYYTYPFLSDRVHASRSFDAYLSAAEPRLGRASLSGDGTVSPRGAAARSSDHHRRSFARSDAPR